LRKAWHTACKLAGVEITFHDLRRTAARNMDRAGVPHNAIKRIMGHKTDAMFSRYRIVAQSDLAEAARTAEGLFARLDAEAGASGGVIQRGKRPESNTDRRYGQTYGHEDGKRRDLATAKVPKTYAMRMVGHYSLGS